MIIIPIIRNIKIKVYLSYHITPVSITKIKQTNNKFWEDRGGNGTPLHSYWDGKLVQTVWESMENYQKSKN